MTLTQHRKKQESSRLPESDHVHAICLPNPSNLKVTHLKFPQHTSCSLPTRHSLLKSKPGTSQQWSPLRLCAWSLQRVGKLLHRPVQRIDSQEIGPAMIIWDCALLWLLLH